MKDNKKNNKKRQQKRQQERQYEKHEKQNEGYRFNRLGTFEVVRIYDRRFGFNFKSIVRLMLKNFYFPPAKIEVFDDGLVCYTREDTVDMMEEKVRKCFIELIGAHIYGKIRERIHERGEGKEERIKTWIFI